MTGFLARNRLRPGMISGHPNPMRASRFGFVIMLTVSFPPNRPNEGAKPQDLARGPKPDRVCPLHQRAILQRSSVPSIERGGESIVFRDLRIGHSIASARI
jgi:hypothetical protein